jgi:Relaxase/Mobilisation nuclease domain
VCGDPEGIGGLGAVPIIINGGSGSAGGWWAKHLQNKVKNNRADVIEFSGLSANNLPDAFREMRGLAAVTKASNYFYQANINPRADEHLTPSQWREAVDTLERNLGLTGQPRFVVEHEKRGRTHRHVVWSRIDQEQGIAISDSLTAPIHERVSRELEIKFDLERGKSVLTPDREFERPDRRPRNYETFRAGETGIDPEIVKAELRSLWQRADNGQSFKAALEASGDYTLARGDRRAFVVIDRAGDEHSLARRLGVKTAEMRAPGRHRSGQPAKRDGSQGADARAAAGKGDPARGRTHRPL